MFLRMRDGRLRAGEGMCTCRKGRGADQNDPINVSGKVLIREPIFAQFCVCVHTSRASAIERELRSECIVTGPNGGSVKKKPRYVKNCKDLFETSKSWCAHTPGSTLCSSRCYSAEFCTARENRLPSWLPLAKQVQRWDSGSVTRGGDFFFFPSSERPPFFRLQGEAKHAWEKETWQEN